jgi:hypothetical protein
MDWVEESRKYLRKIMSSLPKNFLDTVEETAIDVLCDELKKIPVPIVGTILSNTVKKTLKPKPGGPGIQDILSELASMQASDSDFKNGLTAFGEDVHHIDECISTMLNEIRETKKTLTIPKPTITQPKYIPSYPVFDNELQFGFMNAGGGVIIVPEIELIVESWEPETKVNYTTPMAPLPILKLKVELTPKESHYRLLELNNETERRFGAFSEGAEYICIQMSSETNARYKVRISIICDDVTTGETTRFIYPPIGENPIDVRFPYAPGWHNNVTSENMLSRDKILSEILDNFRTLTASLVEKNVIKNSDPANTEREQPDRIEFIHGSYQNMLRAFYRPVIQMAWSEKRSDALPIILKLAHHLLIRDHNNPTLVNLDVDGLNYVSNISNVSEDIRLFFNENNEGKRNNILDRIFSGLK